MQGDSRQKVILAATAVFVVAVLAVTLILKGSIGMQWILSGIVVGSIYTLVAMGFSIIYSSTRAINLAQGEFTMVGGMLMYTFTVQAKLPLWVGFLLAVLIVMILGAVFERAAIHPLKNPNMITIIIITIGFSIALRAAAKWIWGSNPVPARAFTGLAKSGKEIPVKIFGASLSPQSLWIVGLAALAVILVFIFFNKTMLGKGMRAAAENRDAASLVGVSYSTTSLIAWTMAAGLGAAAGAVIGPIQAAVFDVGTMLGLKGFAAAILGGLGSTQGAVAGGLILGILESVVAGGFSSGYKDALAFLILILVLLIRPEGLLGKPEAVKV